MGYVIGCYGERSNGKSTTIRALCKDIETVSNSFIEVLYEDQKNLDSDDDILRAYRRYGLIIFVVSAGDTKELVQEGYSTLNLACGGIGCDILVCALTQNKVRQTAKVVAIEKVIEDIAKENGHWINWLNISKFYDKSNYEKKKISALSALKDAFLIASKNLVNKKLDGN